MEKKIWDALKKEINNDFGVAGLMGNIYCESGMKANNLENQYEKKLGFTDETYVKAVDNGSYDGFINDCAGFGLCQWTYYTRKRALLDFAKKKKKSIGDAEMQIAFLISELKKSYKHCYEVLKNAKSVQEASDVVMVEFEKPADQSQRAKNTRASYGQKFYDKYANTTDATKTATDKPKKPNYKVSTPKGLNVREGAGVEYARVTSMPYKTTVYVSKVKDGWGYIPSHKGWSMLEYMERI